MATAAQRFSGPLLDLYIHVKQASEKDLKSLGTSDALLTLVVACLRYLSQCEKVELTSFVAKKKYFAFADPSRPASLSRPVNSSQFEEDPDVINKDWHAWRESRAVSAAKMARLTYTMAMAYFVAVDLFDRNNKKGPATYFECLIGTCSREVLT